MAPESKIESKTVQGVYPVDPVRSTEAARPFEKAARPPLKARLWNEIRTHPFGYTVLAIFLVAGPIAAPFLFPQAPPAAAVVGGLAFGLYAALSAVPQKFM